MSLPDRLFLTPQYVLIIDTVSISCKIDKRSNGVMVSVPASNAVGRELESRSGQTKDYKIGIYCISTKHAALRSKSKDRLARNQNNVSEWGYMSIRGLLFQ
jgi:hypothetical protein